MPTLEIISINSTGLSLNQADFDVSLIVDNKVDSYSGLFNELLQQQNGCIVHIGNPDLKVEMPEFSFAGQLIDWDFEPTKIIIPEVDPNEPIYNRGSNQQFRFKFLNKYKFEIDKILKIALDKSPIKKVHFLTDYQFGPEKANVEIIYTITDFWTQHDNDGLVFNTMYELYGQ